MALGNAGQAQSLPAIAKYLAHPSAASLRWIDDPRAEEWLLRRLTRDPAVEVRAAAVETFSFRELNARTIAKLKQALAKEKVDSIRRAILAQLGRAR